MAEKRRFLDVWIIESNTVYKEVPFAVVADWVQQGRLLADDMIKPSGTKDWFKLGASPEMAPYLPKVTPHRPDDQAEALEPVMLDFAYKRPREDEDDDVDMIPLIDVSLVLLIFFMLTASAAAVASTVNNPRGRQWTHGRQPQVDAHRHHARSGRPGVFARSRQRESRRGGSRPAHPGGGAFDRLKARLNRATDPVEMVINADKDVKAKTVRDVLFALRGQPFRDKIKLNFFGVSERQES